MPPTFDLLARAKLPTRIELAARIELALWPGLIARAKLPTRIELALWPGLIARAKLPTRIKLAARIELALWPGLISRRPVWAAPLIVARPARVHTPSECNEQRQHAQRDRDPSQPAASITFHDSFPPHPSMSCRSVSRTYASERFGVRRSYHLTTRIA